MNHLMRLALVLAASGLLVQCGDGGNPPKPRNADKPDDHGSSSLAECGNSIKEEGELCDGPDFGGGSCTTLGIGHGQLVCNDGCLSIDTSGCDTGCEKDCVGRECGPDPVCGLSCGTCATGTCNASGSCEVTEPGSPVVLSFATNVASITEGESVTFTAVVTDPDGIEDLIGGTLSNTQGAVYGAFATTAQEGSYALTITWAQIDQVQTIEFETEAARVFVASFYDVAGHITTESISVGLHCGGDTACDGACVNTSNDPNNCGACSVEVSDDLVCEDGEPACYDQSDSLCDGDCVNLDYSTKHCGSCGHACPAWNGVNVDCYYGAVCIAAGYHSVKESCDSLCGAKGYECTAASWAYQTSEGWAEFTVSCGDTPTQVLEDDPGSAFSVTYCYCQKWEGGDDCVAGPENTVAACSDGCTNDGDYYVDCEDYDCCDLVECAKGTACNP